MNKDIKKMIMLTGISILSLHALNKYIYLKATSKNLIDKTESNFYEWRFGKIHYTKKGSGTPLLLVHNLTPGSSLYEFNKIYEKLSEKNEVYCIDLLGYGLSDKPNIVYTNYMYVQLLTDFIKNIIGKKTKIIATGDAVSIAIMTSHNDQELIKEIILINPGSIDNLNIIPEKKSKWFKNLLDTPIIGTAAYNLFTTKKYFEKQFEENYIYDTENVEEKDIETYFESSHLSDYNSKYSFTSYHGKYMNVNITTALSNSKSNITIIYGDIDNKNEILKEYLKLNENIKTIYIPETKQLTHMEKPLELLKKL